MLDDLRRSQLGFTRVLTRGTPHAQAVMPLLTQYHVPLVAPSTGARLIRDAEIAIGLRWQQMENPADYRHEVRAMKVATLAMESIKVEKLGGGKKLGAFDRCCDFKRSA